MKQRDHPRPRASDAESENKDMRHTIRDSPLRNRGQISDRNGSSAKLASGWAYAKLALGMLLATLLVLFVLQNAQAVRVEFLLWEADISQALVLFLTLLSGLGFGVVLNSWLRWRLPRKSQAS